MQRGESIRFYVDPKLSSRWLFEDSCESRSGTYSRNKRTALQQIPPRPFAHYQSRYILCKHVSFRHTSFQESKKSSTFSHLPEKIYPFDKCKHSPQATHVVGGRPTIMVLL